MQPAHQTSRGDLLRWMQRCKTVEEVQLSAALLGYEWQERPPSLPCVVEKSGGIPVVVEAGTRTDRPVLSDPAAQRPPETFYVLSHRERYANPDDEEDQPEGLRGVQPLQDADVKPFAAGQPLPHSPLLSEQRLLPFLRQSLVCSLGQRLDMPTLIKQVSRLQLLQRIPYQPHTVPAGRVYVLLDLSRRMRPFWEDGHALCRLIERKHGRNGLDIREVEDDPHNPYSDWFDRQRGLQPWVPLKPHSQVLIISDMGQLSAKGSAVRQQWLRFVRQLHRQGLCPVVLSPISPQHQCPQLQALTHQVLWGRQSRLKRCSVKGISNRGFEYPPSPTLTPARGEGSLTEVRTGAAGDDEHTASVQRVLGLLSVAAHVEPELLRAVLACLPAHQADSGVEADVYQHPDMVWGHTAISVRPEKRNELHALFRQEPAVLQRQVLALIQQHHIGQFPSVWAEAVLNAQPLVGFPHEELAYLKEAEQFMKRFTRRFAGQGEHEGMAQFARRHLQRLGRDEAGYALCKKSYASALYVLAYREQLQSGMAVSPAYDAAIVQAMVRQRGQVQHYRLIQHGEYLEITAEVRESTGLAVGGLLANLEAVHDTLRVTIGKDENRVFSFPVAEASVLVLHLQGQAVTLDTGLERLRVEPLTQPTWASGIRRDVEGVVATLPWLGSARDVRWEKGWVWPHPFGEDVYGLYLDLEVKGVVQRFRWIKPGTFLMGSPASEVERDDDETQHTVTLTQGFWLADSTVTQALWLAVMGKNPSRFSDHLQHPVEQVSWNDAQDFIQKLNGLISGLQAKLPTEAQWEYACRAGTTTPFSFGNSVTPEQVNYGGNRGRTVPVKSLPANPWGLYEMHGNVWEWCRDVWDGTYPPEATDPEGRAEGDQAGVRRVVRGGSWVNGGRYCRSACRFRDGSDDRSGGLGFRVVLGHIELRSGQGGGAANRQERTARTQTGMSPQATGQAVAVTGAGIAKPSDDPMHSPEMAQYLESLRPKGRSLEELDKPTVAERVVEGVKGFVGLFRRKK